MANFKRNLRTLTDRDATAFMWQFGIGTVAYIALPTLLNKYVFKNREMDGFMGLIVGLISAILLYLFTSWKGALYAGYGHTIGQLTYYGARKIGFEPFNAFPEDTTTVTTTNDYVPIKEYMTPPSFNYLPASTSVNDGVNTNTYEYSEFYH